MGGLSTGTIRKRQKHNGAWEWQAIVTDTRGKKKRQRTRFLGVPCEPRRPNEKGKRSERSGKGAKEAMRRMHEWHDQLAAEMPVTDETTTNVLAPVEDVPKTKSAKKNEHETTPVEEVPETTSSGTATTDASADNMSLKRIWIVDTENTAASHASSYADICAGDEVWWPWTSACRTMSLVALEAMGRSKATLHVTHAKCGQKNALDFQIVSMLGYLIAKHGHGAAYGVITDDAGFESAVKFWCDRGYDVVRKAHDNSQRSLGFVSNAVYGIQRTAETDQLDTFDATENPS